MRSEHPPGRRRATALLISAVCAALAGAAGAQTPTFKSGTRIVPLFVTVSDPNGRLVPDLVRDDFQVFDNDRPQTISVFDNETKPVTVAVMLDTSLSMTLNMDLLKKASEQFFIRMLPEDRATVASFNDKIEFTTELTGDRDALVSSLDGLGYGNPTRLYDAIDAALDQLHGIEGRRVVLVFTDGDDTYSKRSFGSVLQRARDEEVMIYSIGLESDLSVGGHRVRTRIDRGLKKLSDETGGGYFELDKTSDLGPTFTRVAQELHSQYLVGFSPATLDGKVHKLEVKMTRPGTTARARKSYLAAAEGSGRESR